MWLPSFSLTTLRGTFGGHDRSNLESQNAGSLEASGVADRFGTRASPTSRLCRGGKQECRQAYTIVERVRYKPFAMAFGFAGSRHDEAQGREDFGRGSMSKSGVQLGPP
jgi:hypothetical protein